MRLSKRILSLFLCFALILPMLQLPAFAAEDEAVSIDNGYIEASVSLKNGGFLIKTVEGDLLEKSDNNKKLLYHNGHYDTSFVSFRVGSGKDARDYLFGGKYPGSSGVTVAKTAGGEIAAVWSVDGITFTQLISLAEDNSNEHGMVSISLSARNDSGRAVPVKARVLLDTCLGDKDYSYYQFTGMDYTQTLDQEQIITDPVTIRSFYSIDDVADPRIAAYVVSEPEKVAIGHWNDLASSLFDFAPDEGMGFTNISNEFLTADSACAMYYDLGTVASGGAGSALLFYGIYSNSKVKLQNSVAINAVAPMRLQLNGDRSGYVRESSVGQADFSVTVSAENYKSDSSRKLRDVKLAVTSTSGLRPLSDSGQPVSGLDFSSASPLTVPYAEIEEGETVTKTVHFQAKPLESASYERITIGMYEGEITGDRLLGEKVIYLLLPGNDGNIPKIGFISMKPDTVYNSGTRHLYAAVSNDVLLDDSLSAGNAAFKAYSTDGKKSWSIPASNITVNDGIADIVLDGELELPVGNYYLQLEWSDAAVDKEIVEARHQKQTAECLKFGISDNPKYRNDSYGVLAVVKYGKGTADVPYYYRIERFADEAGFQSFSSAKDHAWKEILIVLRGAFTADNRYLVKENGKTTGGLYYSAVSKKVVDPRTRKEKIDNPVTINNCVDFEGGTISIYYENYEQGVSGALGSPILVEIDGELYTSGARTSVWTGKAALTKIEQGNDYSLIRYTANGVRKQSNSTPITLIWPNVFSVAQTIAGMVFKLAYGQFGVMEVDGKEADRVISFSAGLSLSFLSVADDDDTDYGTANYFGRMQELWKDWRGASIYQYAYHGSRFEKLTDLSMNDRNAAPDTQKGAQASVMIQDILFGKEGLVGLNFEVDVTIRNVIENFAAIEGKLSINTINDWSFGLAGNCKMTDKIKMEAKLSFKSKNDIPIPDELYFYIGGIKPGLNADGCGVIWITGAGGGFSNLYDTIFCTSGLPPLKLIMTLSFSLIQVLDGTGKLEMSLNGFTLTGTDIKVADTIEVIKKVQLGFQWLPDLKLHAAIYVSMFEKCIEGNGYIILVGKDYSDWFFEMFLRAAVKIPASVPAVGGMNIAAADLGINTEKIWGAVEVVKIYTGITYYWGEEGVKFGSSGDKAYPTYPNLLFQGTGEKEGGYPVAYDEENDRTLYMKVGTNFEAPSFAQPMSEGDLILMDARGIWSDGDKTAHKFNLGDYRSGNTQSMIQISFDAESLEEARALAAGFSVTDAKGGGNELPLTFYDGSNIDEADANVTWYEGKASMGFSVTDPAHFGKNWFISTGSAAADVLMYNVQPLPELDSVSAGGALAAGGSAEISWTGSALDELDSVSFFLAESDDPSSDAGYPLTGEDGYGSLTDSAVISGGSASLTVPADIPAGDYLVRAVYSKDDQVNGVIHSSSRVRLTNDNTPAAIDSLSIASAGDLKFSVTVPEPADSVTTVYAVSVYDEDGNATDITDMTVEKAEDGATRFEVGGSYTAPVKADGSDPDSATRGSEVFGLEGGRRYIIGVTPCAAVDNDGDGEADTMVYGREYLSQAVLLPEAVTPELRLSAGGKTLTAISDMADGAAETVFGESSLDFSASFSEAVSGTWILDDSGAFGEGEEGAGGSFGPAQSASFRIEGLSDGTHTLTLRGSALDGDRFSESYSFTVDTEAPRLMISSPLSGSAFGEGGRLLIEGISSPDALLSVSIDGRPVISGKTVSQAGGSIDSEGIFSIELSIPEYNSRASHSVTIAAEDVNGNSTEPYEAFVVNPALGDLAEIVIMADGAEPPEGNIDTSAAGSASLSLAGITSKGMRFALDPDMVLWSASAAEGEAVVSSDGKLSYAASTKGFVTAMVEISSGAYRSAYLTLGSDSAEGFVSVSSTIGGSASGGGYYAPGSAVVLRASADTGYAFKGWQISGVSVADSSAAEISFTMPAGSVSAKALFESEGGPKPQPAPSGGSGSDSVLGYKDIPEGADPMRYVAVYTDAGGSVKTVPMSAVDGRTLIYLKPEGRAVRFEERPAAFSDIEGHWAKDYVIRAAASGLFSGVGEGKFDPQGTMTRAMFVTVLYRLAGSPKTGGSCRFTDVAKGSWYEIPVIWAQEGGIVSGVSETSFDPNGSVTREQMCALVARYIRSAGYKLELGAKKSFTDAASIASWAAEDVEFCQRAGIIEGKSGGGFDPKGFATRAENAAVMRRLTEAVIRSLR